MKSGRGYSEEASLEQLSGYMADIMETNPDNSPVSVPLEEVFYME